MSKKKYPTDQTKCVDWCICPYCGYVFDGYEEMNGDMDRSTVDCPKCNKTMHVSVSIEYMCTVMEE